MSAPIIHQAFNFWEPTSVNSELWNYIEDAARKYRMKNAKEPNWLKISRGDWLKLNTDSIKEKKFWEILVGSIAVIVDDHIKDSEPVFE